MEIQETPSNAFDAIAQIQEAMAVLDLQIEDLKQEQKARRSEIVTIAKNALVGLDGEDMRAFVATLYWKYQDSIPVALLTEATGRHIHALIEYVGKAIIPTTCRGCGRPHTVTADSRSDYGNVIKYIRGSYPYPMLFCPECTESQDAKRRSEYEAAQRQREAYVNWLRTMPYREYLQTDHWKDVRSRALKRANFRCHICNSNRNLHVHHRTYVNRGQEDNKDVIVLCADCHQTFHENGKVQS